jgi:hypothetical protein
VVRLKANTTIEQATAAANTLAARLAREFEQTNRDWSVMLVPPSTSSLLLPPALLVLVGAVVLLLVIGCLNVASLLLTRALSREREIAVRIAMARRRVNSLRSCSQRARVVLGRGRARVLMSFVALPPSSALRLHAYRDSTKLMSIWRRWACRCDRRDRDNGLRPRARARAGARKQRPISGPRTWQHAWSRAARTR